MARTLLIVVGVLYGLTAAVMWVAPQTWYDTTPGVAMMGPFNAHFIRDVALAFLVSAAALLVGARQDNRPLAIFGAAWPCLHAAFHIWIWLGRGVPVDVPAVTNLFGIQLPAWLALFAAFRLEPRSSAQ